MPFVAPPPLNVVNVAPRLGYNTKTPTGYDQIPLLNDPTRETRAKSNAIAFVQATARQLVFNTRLHDSDTL